MIRLLIYKCNCNNIFTNHVCGAIICVILYHKLRVKCCTFSKNLSVLYLGKVWDKGREWQGGNVAQEGKDLGQSL